jgi:hypothetical protein
VHSRGGATHRRRLTALRECSEQTELCRFDSALHHQLLWDGDAGKTWLHLCGADCYEGLPRCIQRGAVCFRGVCDQLQFGGRCGALYVWLNFFRSAAGSIRSMVLVIPNPSLHPGVLRVTALGTHVASDAQHVPLIFRKCVIGKNDGLPLHSSHVFAKEACSLDAKAAGGGLAFAARDHRRP